MVEILRTKEIIDDKTKEVIGVIEYLSCGHVNNLMKDGTKDFRKNPDGVPITRKSGVCPKGCP